MNYRFRYFCVSKVTVTPNVNAIIATRMYPTVSSDMRNDPYTDCWLFTPKPLDMIDITDTNAIVSITVMQDSIRVFNISRR